MSLDRVTDKYVKDNNVIITSAPGHGATSLVYAIINRLCMDQCILLYSPVMDREFIKEYYKNMFNNVCFMSSSIEEFIDFITQSITNEHTFKYIAIDPADPLLLNSDTLLHISNATKTVGINIICTSQIRQDPNQGGKPYSTIGRWNKLHVDSGVFRYSIWLRNVTGTDPFYDSKYTDVFEISRQGNRYIERYIVKFQKKEGYVVA